MQIIQISKIQKNWHFFWIKSIHNVKLENHCAKCFVGHFIKNIAHDELRDIELPPAPFYYICGVAKKGGWANNFHLAIHEKIGSVVNFTDKGVSIIIQDAIAIPIIPLEKGASKFRNRDKKEYYTCRNWQFGNQVADYFNYTEPELPPEHP